MRKQRTRTIERGFTLVEVLVATLLFAIGMIAVMAIQFSALGGYTSARNVTQATQVGRRVIQMMRMESQAWQGSSSPEFPYNHDMDGDGNADFDDSQGDAILSKVSGSNHWKWNRVFVRPVDTRMTTLGAQRFCVYVRGEEFTLTSGRSVRRTHVAVVYPGASGKVADSAGKCVKNGSSITIGTGGGTKKVTLTDKLEFDGNGVIKAERKGFRVVFLAAIVERRAHLGS
ncbi:MAG: prepilin-type N-terminal cleavage/methylation domain-containing protein [Bradymonadaceae bacterium]